MRIKLKKLNDQGMVSIIVTMVLIIVMTLVVLAMSQNAVREQRQSLDRQLSDQAFYNAESGINDWVEYLYKNPDAKNVENDCDKSEFLSPPPLSPNITSDGNNKYTCLLYDKTPKTIILNPLTITEPKTIPITPHINLNSLTFTWKSTGSNNAVGGCPSGAPSPLPSTLASGGPCTVGGLRVDLVDPGGAAINRDNLRTSNFIGYFLPSRNSGPASTVGYPSGKGTPGVASSIENQGVISVAACDASECKLTINAINLLANNTFFLHLRSIYEDNNVTISGTRADGTSVNFIGAQIMLDSTGKSSDVLRRVQVRVGATSQYEGTDFSLRTADSICKLISVNKDALPSGTATLEGCTAN